MSREQAGWRSLCPGSVWSAPTQSKGGVDKTTIALTGRCAKRLWMADVSAKVQKLNASGTPAALIGSVWLVASVAAWLLRRWSGFIVAAWVAPLAISTFCLGLFVGAENTTKGRFRAPFLSHHMHSPHLAHRSVIVELRRRA